jgi:CRP-like cAMP-binding protein
MPRAALELCCKLEEEMFYKDVGEFLCTTPLFANVSMDSLEMLCQKFQVYEFSENRIIVHEDDPLEGLFIVLTGQCRVLQSENQHYSHMSRCGSGVASVKSLQSTGSDTSSLGGMESISESTPHPFHLPFVFFFEKLWLLLL